MLKFEMGSNRAADTGRVAVLILLDLTHMFDNDELSTYDSVSTMKNHTNKYFPHRSAASPCLPESFQTLTLTFNL